MTPARMQEMHIAEEFLKSLPEMTYHVTKINQWGKHQVRLLRLTVYVFKIEVFIFLI